MCHKYRRLFLVQIKDLLHTLLGMLHVSSVTGYATFIALNLLTEFVEGYIKERLYLIYLRYSLFLVGISYAFLFAALQYHRRTCGYIELHPFLLLFFIERVGDGEVLHAVVIETVSSVGGTIRVENDFIASGRH